MHTNPKDDRTRVDHILLEQFLGKGYKCEEVCEKDATIFVITHQKKYSDGSTLVLNETYKELFGTN